MELRYTVVNKTRNAPTDIMENPTEKNKEFPKVQNI